jgi:hypothetical protein
MVNMVGLSDKSAKYKQLPPNYTDPILYGPDCSVLGINLLLSTTSNVLLGS